jgi:acyl-CoA reductase-like NAD-dependent aldehyde dehydrogenase
MNLEHARVSTASHDLDRQVEALVAAGIDWERISTRGRGEHRRAWALLERARDRDLSRCTPSTGSSVATARLVSTCMISWHSSHKSPTCKE